MHQTNHKDKNFDTNANTNEVKKQAEINDFD